MSNAIDCSRMSHVSCAVETDQEPLASATTTPTAESSDAATNGGAATLRDSEGRAVGSASYECVNDCVSSLGVTALVSGATVSLGCLVLPPACPIFIGASVGSVLGACEVACEDLESKP
jgi:hypothetical protein